MGLGWVKKIRKWVHFGEVGVQNVRRTGDIIYGRPLGEGWVNKIRKWIYFGEVGVQNVGRTVDIIYGRPLGEGWVNKIRKWVYFGEVGVQNVGSSGDIIYGRPLYFNNRIIFVKRFNRAFSIHKFFFRIFCFLRIRNNSRVLQ